jgi:hypothetical protein
MQSSCGLWWKAVQKSLFPDAKDGMGLCLIRNRPEISNLADHYGFNFCCVYPRTVEFFYIVANIILLRFLKM